MKRTLCTIAVLALLIAPASAKIGEAELSGSYIDTERGGETASVTGGVYAPFGRFLVGPAGMFSYIKTPGGESITGTAGGVVVEWHVLDKEKGVMPFLRGEGFKWFGEAEDRLDYEYGIGAGIKVGDDATSLKFVVVRSWIEGTNEEHTTARIGFVWRL